MNAFKHWKIMCLVVCVVLFTFSAALPDSAGNGEALWGDWECLVQTEDEDAEDFIFFLCFSESGQVTYVAGWYLSEIACVYTGAYTVENDDVLKLEMTDAESSDTMSATYAFTVLEGTLTLTKQSGDGLSYLFEDGVPMVFTAVVPQESE